MAALLDPESAIDFVQDFFPGAPPAQSQVVGVNTFPVREIMGQLPPLAPCFDQIQNGVDHDPQRMFAAIAIPVGVLE